MALWFGVPQVRRPRHLVLVLLFGAATAHAQIVAPPSSGTVVVDGTTVTATGDLSAGLDIDGPTVDTLLINSLNQNLGNTGAADAVSFNTLNSNIFITMDLGVFQGSASGLLADVIDATVTGDGNITIDSTGDLMAGLGNGILGNVTGNGNVIITSQGNITSNGLGINGLVGDAGNVTIRSTGNITVTSPIPVFPAPPTRPAGIRAAVTNAGQVEVFSMGDITVNGGSIASGIQANEFLGLVTARSVSIVSIGNISASGDINSFGIQTGHDIGPIQITSTGDITADTGISTLLGTSGDVTISSTGSILASDQGIFASTPSGMVQLTIDGGVVSGADGILSNSPGGGTMISILQGGTVQSIGAGGTDRGIEITSGASQVTVAGSVIGGGGGAIQFAAGNFNDILELQPGFGMTGIVRADAGTDTLRFGGSGSGNFDLSSIDTGGNTQQYREFEVFEVNSGTWTFSNGTAAAFVANGGVVTGDATFGGLTANSGSTIAPGNGVGTITVNGNAAFNPGSNLALDIRPDGSGDLLNVTGTTTISGNGTSLNAALNPLTTPLTASTWTAITATGGVTGEFATVADNLPDLDLLAVYNPDSVQLTLVAAAADSDPSAFSRKEIHPSAQMAALDTSLLYVETLRRRGGLLNSISGSSSDLSSRSLPDIESSPWHTTVPAGAHVGYEPEWSAWSAFMGSDTSVDGNDGIPGWNSTRYGFAFGFENRDPADFHFPGRVGFSAGYLTTDLATGASDAEIESWHLGFYATTQAGPLSLSGAAAFAHFDFEFDRFVSLGNGAVIANGDADGNSVSGSFEAFLDLAGNEREGFRFGPIATLGMVYGDRGGFSETGAGLLNLTVDADDGFQTISGLGLAMGVDRTLGGIPVTVEARALWEHVFGDTGVTTNSTIPFVGGAFSTSSAAIERNRASFGLGYALQLSEDVSAHIRYDGTFFDSVEDHRGSVGITVEF